MVKHKIPTKVETPKTSSGMSTLHIIPSSVLKSIREIIDDSEGLKKIVGVPVQFHLVFDSNVLLGQIIWSSKRRNPLALAQLHEAILAGTIIPHVTTRVINEVESHIPEIAAQKRASPESYLTEWLRLKPLLQVEDPDPLLVKTYSAGRDPTDAPTLALAEYLNVVGIVSKDHDIAAMGGRIVSDEFITAARDYSRQAALNVTIKIGGCYVALGAGKGLRKAISILNACIGLLRGSRAEVKAIIFIIIILITVHPKSRNTIVSSANNLLVRFPDLTESLLQCVIYVSGLLESNPALPPMPCDYISKS